MGFFEEMFSETDREAIKRYINTYAGKPKVSVDSLLSPWYQAKSNYLFDIFGDKLILEKEVEFEPNETELNAQMDVDKCIDTYLHRINFKIFNIVISQYPNGNKKLWDRRPIFTTKSLITNSYKHWYDLDNKSTLPLIDKKGNKFYLREGDKTTKAIGRFVKMFDLDYQEFERFRIKVSQYLNEKKIFGTLCLSIHPLDYMTMSDNAHKWTSCMSWSGEGGYRQGTVEMMNSPMVVVAYLKSKQNMRISSYPAIEWNSKKWRELFIVNHYCITSIKDYPYHNNSLEIATLNWLRELCNGKLANYSDKYYIFENDKDFEIDDDNIMNFCFSTEIMYNDFGATPDGTHKIYVSDLALEKDDSWISIDYSGDSECLCCGTLNPYFADEGQLVCEDCIPYDEVCECCGQKIFHYDSYTIDDTIMCEDCYEDCSVEDILHNEIHNMDNCTYFSLCDPNGEQALITLGSWYVFNQDTEELFDKITSLDKEDYGFLRIKTQYYMYRDCIPVQYITEEGKEMLGIDDIQITSALTPIKFT